MSPFTGSNRAINDQKHVGLLEAEEEEETEEEEGERARGKED